jgi:hypothetical protein
MPATKTRRPVAPVTVKKGKPSASGEVVDTKKAKVVPASPEVRVAEDAAKSKAKLDATIGKAVAKMTGRDDDAAADSLARDDADRAAAVLSINDDREAAEKGHTPPKAKAKGKAKAAKAKAVRSSGNGAGPTTRITEAWTGNGGKEVEVGSTVKVPDFPSTLTIAGRWTKRSKDQLIPFVTGVTPDGTRKNVAAADCQVVKGPAAKK